MLPAGRNCSAGVRHEARPQAARPERAPAVGGAERTRLPLGDPRAHRDCVRTALPVDRAPSALTACASVPPPLRRRVRGTVVAVNRRTGILPVQRR